MRRALAVPAVVVALLATAAPASATDATDGGLWYYTATGMDELHQRTTGSGVTIAILDDPVNPDVADLAGSNLQITQPSYCASEAGGPGAPSPTSGPLTQHGTLIASLLVGTGQGTDGEPGVRGVAPGASVLSYTIRSVSDGHCHNPANTEGTGHQAIRDAVAAGADIINVSGTAYVEGDAYLDALRAGVIIVGAAGNEGGPLAGAPAVTNGAVAVGTVTADRTLDESSPQGPEMGVVAPGSDVRCLDTTLAAYARCTGSSIASAYTSGVLALLWSLHPDATSNQILQALVHTTDGEARETPEHDDAWGFGTVNARLLMDSDPMSFPDVNPFIREGEDEWPTAAELRGTAATPPPANDDSGEETTGSPAENTDEDTTDDTSTGAGLLIGVGAAAVLLTVAVVIVLIRVRRRRTPDPTPDTNRPPQPTHHGGHHG